jgi:hypothetical protein
MPISREKLFFGHSLLTNKFPIKGRLEDYPKIISSSGEPLDLESFGLFDSSSPNFNTFYPDLKPADLEPNDEDFVYPLFRALSAILINKIGPLDFSKKGVLEAGVKLIIGQTVYNNHEQLIGNDVGVVLEASFEGHRTYEGVSVPGGINVRLKIDGKANPKLARSLMSDPPSVHSVSVTVLFTWEQSHPKMDKDEFFNKLGTFDEKGNLIRRVVTKIMRFDEISFVPHGADPYAKLIKDNKIVDPKESQNRHNIATSFNAEDFEKYESHYDYKVIQEAFKEEILSLSDDTIPDTSINNKSDNKNTEKMNKEFLTFLIGFFSLAADSTEEQVVEAVNKQLPKLKLTESQQNIINEFSEFVNEKPNAKVYLIDKEQKIKLDDYDNLKVNHNELESNYNKVLESTRQESLRLYHLTIGGSDKADKSVTKLIAEGTMETLTALSKQYKNQLEEKFQGKCKDCGSKNVTRMSSQQANSGITNPNDEDEEGGQEPKSMADVMAEIQKSNKPAAGFQDELYKKDNKD